MTTPSSQQGSLERLTEALGSGSGTPIVVAGDVGSGRTSLIHSAARALGYEVIEREAWNLARPLGGHSHGGFDMPGPFAAGEMSNQLDELRALSVIRHGDDLVIVVDHLDLAAGPERDAIIEAMEFLAQRVRVVAVATTDLAAGLPRGWQQVSHDAHDAVRWWTQPPARPNLRVLPGSGGGLE